MGATGTPFTLLGGYLGAGKTTLLNRLLAAADGERIAVLVNDVGAVNVDAALIADHDGETLELTNGCVCCAIADDFVTTLEQVRAMSPPPDRVVMELSGVAEPARLVPWANTTGFRLDGIVVVVDAEQFADQLGRRFVADAVDAQARAADLVVVAKCDLVGSARIDDVRRLVGERTRAPIVEATIDGVPVGSLFGLDAVGAYDHAPAMGATSTAPVATRLVDVDVADREALDRLLGGLAATVLRAKGLVVIDDVVHEVHVVGHRRSVRPRPDLEVGAADGRLVVIELVEPTDRVS